MSFVLVKCNRNKPVMKITICSFNVIKTIQMRKNKKQSRHWLTRKSWLVCSWVEYIIIITHFEKRSQFRSELPASNLLCIPFVGFTLFDKKKWTSKNILNKSRPDKYRDLDSTFYIKISWKPFQAVYFHKGICI